MKRKMQQSVKFREYMWLAIAILSAIFAGYKLTVDGVEDGLIFLIVPAVAGLMYKVRRFMRVRIESISDEKTEDNDNV